jgi:hypothetical protein
MHQDWLLTLSQTKDQPLDPKMKRIIYEISEKANKIKVLLNGSSI